MKRRNAIVTLAALSISLFTIVPASIAQQPDGDQGPQPEMGMMGPGMMGQGMGRGGMMGMMGGGCPMMAMMGRNDAAPTFAEGRIAFIKAELAITEAQNSVWDAYSAALRKNLESMQSMRKTMMSATQPASPVERLDLHVSTMESRLQTLKEVKPALAALYAALSEGQKKKADDLLTGMGCMM
jgi:LTXXQ motif family protein